MEEIQVEQWQAMSHPELESWEPSELFDHDFAVLFHELHDDLWRRITRLHGTISTLEELETFPFALVYGPEDMEFWRLVAFNFSDMAIVHLHALIGDQEPDAHTLNSLKNKVARASWRDAISYDDQATEIRRTRSQVKRTSKRDPSFSHRASPDRPN
jgi:hypothetical protein